MMTRKEGGRTKSGAGEEGGGQLEKRRVGRIGYNKLTEATPERSQLAVIIDVGGGNESEK